MEAAAVGPSLAGALKDSAWQVRQEAARALGTREQTSAVPGLSAALRDGDARVRQMAAWALGQIGNGRE